MLFTIIKANKNEIIEINYQRYTCIFILIVILIVCIPINIQTIIHKNYLIKNGLKTNAIVYDIKEVEYGGQPGETGEFDYKLYVEYIIDNQKYQAVLEHDTQNYNIGDKIEIIYNVNDYYDITSKDSNKYEILYIICGIIIAVLVLFTMIKNNKSFKPKKRGKKYGKNV